MNTPQPPDLDPHGKPWATAAEIDAARPATEWNPPEPPEPPARTDTYQRIITDQAIGAFRKAEQKRLQLEQAEHALEKLLTGRLDLDRYVAETEEIRAEYEGRREAARIRGLLPKDR